MKVSLKKWHLSCTPKDKEETVIHRIISRTFLNERVTRAKKQKWKVGMLTRGKVDLCSWKIGNQEENI